MADEIQDHIKSMVDNTGMFSELIDEHIDKAGHEELAICYRFIDNAGGIT